MITAYLAAGWLAGSVVSFKYYPLPSSRGDKFARRSLISDHFRYVERNKLIFLVCLEYTKTIIQLSVSESGVYLPSPELRWIIVYYSFVAINWIVRLNQIHPINSFMTQFKVQRLLTYPCMNICQISVAINVNTPPWHQM